MRDKCIFGHEEKENTSDTILFAGECASEEKGAYKYISKVFEGFWKETCNTAMVVC